MGAPAAALTGETQELWTAAWPKCEEADLPHVVGFKGSVPSVQLASGEIHYRRSDSKAWLTLLRTNGP